MNSRKRYPDRPGCPPPHRVLPPPTQPTEHGGCPESRKRAGADLPSPGFSRNVRTTARNSPAETRPAVPLRPLPRKSSGIAIRC